MVHVHVIVGEFKIIFMSDRSVATPRIVMVTAGLSPNIIIFCTFNNSTGSDSTLDAPSVNDIGTVIPVDAYANVDVEISGKLPSE